MSGHEPGGQYAVRDTTFYGAPIGVLMIDSSEPFIPGDVGNASTFDFPVRYRRVDGCSIDRLVRANDPTLVGPVVAAARALVAEGALALTSNCGFMLRMQRPVADAVDVPVLLSGLLQLRLVEECIGAGRKIGVITSTAASLDTGMLRLTGADLDRIVVAGLDDCASFRAAFLDEGGLIRPDLVEAEVAAVTRDLVDEHDVGAIVMECAALSPYAHAMQQAGGGVPLFDAVSLIDLWYRGLFRTRFRGHY